MSDFTIKRTFSRKGDAEEIGTVRLDVPSVPWKLDGEVLPPESVAYLLSFSLQCLQDAYAGADGFGDAQMRWAGKYQKLRNGNLTSRGPTVSPVQVIMRDSAKAIMVTLGYDKPKMGVVDQWIADNPEIAEKLEAQAEQVIELRKALSVDAADLTRISNLMRDGNADA